MRPSTFAARAYAFYKSLKPPRVPRGVTVMNPYTDPLVLRNVRAFLTKYYSDDRERMLILGINPGRFGAGITGITFTDPVALADFCGIPNALPRRREVSSEFIYRMIEAFGPIEDFYSRFFVSAVCPLGFTAHGKNLNYYDDRALERAVTPFIVETLRAQIALGCRTDRVVVLGQGENRRFLESLNLQHGFFGEVVPLMHPRPIMQYQRRFVKRHIRAYTQALRGLAP